jgi:hypothetical protein
MTLDSLLDTCSHSHGIGPYSCPDTTNTKLPLVTRCLQATMPVATSVDGTLRQIYSYERLGTK